MALGWLPLAWPFAWSVAVPMCRIPDLSRAPFVDRGALSGCRMFLTVRPSVPPHSISPSCSGLKSNSCVTSAPQSCPIGGGAMWSRMRESSGSAAMLRTMMPNAASASTWSLIMRAPGRAFCESSAQHPRAALPAASAPSRRTVISSEACSWSICDCSVTRLLPPFLVSMTTGRLESEPCMRSLCLAWSRTDTSAAVAAFMVTPVMALAWRAPGPSTALREPLTTSELTCWRRRQLINLRALSPARLPASAFAAVDMPSCM